MIIANTSATLLFAVVALCQLILTERFWLIASWRIIS